MPANDSKCELHRLDTTAAPHFAPGKDPAYSRALPPCPPRVCTERSNAFLTQRAPKKHKKRTPFGVLNFVKQTQSASMAPFLFIVLKHLVQT